MPGKCVAYFLGLFITANVFAADAGLPVRRVATILEQQCLSCHNSNDKKGGLSLETRADMLAGGDGGAAITLGDADGSMLVEFISGTKLLPAEAGRFGRNRGND